MRRIYWNAVAVGVWLSAASTLAMAQDPHRLNIDDAGEVASEHQQHHAKKGDKISWVRQTDAAKTWYVKFTRDSPCAEGKEFGAGHPGACTVKAVCNKAGDRGCKSYHYRSGVARTAPLNDPEIIIDP
jgi:hypothetical protein